VGPVGDHGAQVHAGVRAEGLADQVPEGQDTARSLRARFRVHVTGRDELGQGGACPAVEKLENTRHIQGIVVAGRRCHGFLAPASECLSIN
jgi:hypothetical protein